MAYIMQWLTCQQKKEELGAMFAGSILLLSEWEGWRSYQDFSCTRKIISLCCVMKKSNKNPLKVRLKKIYWFQITTLSTSVPNVVELYYTIRYKLQLESLHIQTHIQIHSLFVLSTQMHQIKENIKIKFQVYLMVKKKFSRYG